MECYKSSMVFNRSAIRRNPRSIVISGLLVHQHPCLYASTVLDHTTGNSSSFRHNGTLDIRSRRTVFGQIGPQRIHGVFWNILAVPAILRRHTLLRDESGLVDLGRLDFLVADKQLLNPIAGWILNLDVER